MPTYGTPSHRSIERKSVLILNAVHDDDSNALGGGGGGGGFAPPLCRHNGEGAKFTLNIRIHTDRHLTIAGT